MNCLVTGASGYIGSSLIKRLVKDDHKVKGLIHQKQPSFLEKNVEYIQGDITDVSSIRNVVKDAEVVFHCAALVRDLAPKNDFYKINLQGTKNIVEACIEHAIKRFIFLSHIQYESPQKSGHYSISKAMAEQYLLDRYKNGNFPVVIMRPGNVYGPGYAIWVFVPLRAIEKDRISLINSGNGIFHHTYIDNLVDALTIAMQKPNIDGETIDITDGDNSTTWGQYLNALAKMLGKPPIKRNMSKSTAMALSKIMMLLYSIFRVKPWVTPTAVEVFTNQNKTSIEKAESLLGYKPRIDYETGIKKVENWLKSEGYIP